MYCLTICERKKRLLLGLLFLLIHICIRTTGAVPHCHFFVQAASAISKQNIFVLIKQELGNEINYLVHSGESTALVCSYGRDVGGVMEGEVPFLAYFSYCAHYLVLPDKSM